MFSAFRACSVMQNSPLPVPTRKPPATFTQSVCCARVLTGEQMGQFVKPKRGIPCLCKKCATGLTHVQFVATENVSCPVSPQCLPVLYLHLFPLDSEGTVPAASGMVPSKAIRSWGNVRRIPRAPSVPCKHKAVGQPEKEPVGTIFSLMCSSHTSGLLSNGP